jgi:hypothetical protein
VSHQDDLVAVPEVLSDRPTAGLLESLDFSFGEPGVRHADEGCRIRENTPQI